MSQADENRQIDDEQAERLVEGSLADALGIQVHYAPDAEAPPIDYRALRALVRRELDDEAAREVTHLVATYRPWHEACREVLIQEAGESK